ncbi:hypothetical protein N7495_004716 [Penicillium taxi]|uniref:uncharacterized protein n=1 Tax=Penicillium taxi TaxID=168475 RepID=UPI002545061B|nr:uncharacterized protein N7495_004716 [Penicillium taxi]KAJ5899972.1 hypothetical protein N7495_004716 [Penicillium taxi]
MAPSKSMSALHVTDLRENTLRENTSFTITVHPGGYVDATALAGIKDARGKGLIVLDEGSRNTASIKSAVSNLDAETGQLQYRQHAVEDLFGKYGFAENVHLLTFGSLANAGQRKALDRAFAESMLIYMDALPVIHAFSRDAPMMTMIMGGLSACNALQPHFIPVHDDHDVYGDAKSFDEHVIRTHAALAVVGSSYPDPAQVRHLDDLVLLHSEHGACNATIAFLHTASTRADPISCLLAGLAAIYGPMHGGSNIVTYHQLKTIGSIAGIPAVIKQVKNKERRLYGFGHRIYRTIDPRATLLKQFLQDRASKGVSISPYMPVALELERIVESDPFFTSRHLKANTDLYTVLAYESIGIPEDLVFPFICISRTVGFLAHWREFMGE